MKPDITPSDHDSLLSSFDPKQRNPDSDDLSPDVVKKDDPEYYSGKDANGGLDQKDENDHAAYLSEHIVNADENNVDYENLFML